MFNGKPVVLSAIRSLRRRIAEFQREGNTHIYKPEDLAVRHLFFKVGHCAPITSIAIAILSKLNLACIATVGVLVAIRGDHLRTVNHIPKRVPSLSPLRDLHWNELPYVLNRDDIVDVDMCENFGSVSGGKSFDFFLIRA